MNTHAHGREDARKRRARRVGGVHPARCRTMPVHRAAVLTSEHVWRVELAVERDLRSALRAALLHEPRDLRLALEEPLERFRVRPLVDHKYFPVTAGEC